MVWDYNELRIILLISPIYTYMPVYCEMRVLHVSCLSSLVLELTPWPDVYAPILIFKATTQLLYGVMLVHEV